MALPKLNNIQRPSHWLSLIVDLLMLGLTIFDLAWLMFDALYTTQTIQQLVHPIFPTYEAIHKDFYFYDGIIVSIFIAELLGRWLWAIYRRQYDKWFFYPFIHWYDVLGCFPTSSFRILRLFRIIGLTYRLHKWQVIDLNNYAVFNTLTNYYNIIMEEISDRIVVRVLSEAKAEIQRGQPFSEALVQQVIKPKQYELAQQISAVIQEGIQNQYPQYKKLLQKHLTHTVRSTVKANHEVQQLERIPIIGNTIQQNLNSAISSIVFGVIDRLIQDASAEEHQQVIVLAIDSILEVLLQKENFQQTNLSNELLINTIDLIVERVNVKQWKIDGDNSNPSSSKLSQ